MTQATTALRDLIEPSGVIADLRVRDKGQLLAELANLAATRLRLDPAPIAAALAARERLGSTGFGQGFALPHARLDGLARPAALFARLGRPVDFEAVDGQPVDLVVLLLLPTQTDQTNVSALAAIARDMRNTTKLARLRKARGEAALYAAVTAPIDGH